jgi:MtaA/CmuA family methyltransferase
MRETILDLLSGKKIDAIPMFSGLIHITVDGLNNERLAFHEIQHDAQKMAQAAASTFKLTGIPSAALPLDLCTPAEALGAELKYYEDGLYQFPQVAKAWVNSTKVITGDIEKLNIRASGRIGLICDAISMLKKDIGNEVVISGTIPGPYTLLLYICDTSALFVEMKKEPQVVKDALIHLTNFLAQIGEAYREAGADFITIHDMGGSPGFIGPARYEQFVMPAERTLIDQLSGPRVLSVCGNVTNSLHLLNPIGADAISIDQTTDLTKAREILKDTLLFGNIDPVQTLWQGDEAQVREAVRGAKEAGVDSIWPGCDLVPQMPIQNVKSMLEG